MTGQPVTLTETERVVLDKAHYLTPPTLEDDPIHQAVEQILTARLSARDDEWRERIEALAGECFMTRSADLRCSDYIGGTFPNGTVFTEEICCLPCRVHLLAQPTPDGGK